MNWSLYHYLAPAALVALVALFVVSRLIPRLSESHEHRTPLEVTLLVLFCAFGLGVIYFNHYREIQYFAFPTGDAASDTIEQYIPFYVNLIDHVREGKVALWNWEYELGTNIPSYQSWFYDPFNIIVVGLTLLLGNAHLSLALVTAQSAKILLSALLFDHLLTRYCETPLARILGSLVYAFTGMVVLQGQHYFLGGALPFFTATILVFELFLERPRPLSFLVTTLVVALQLCWSAYMAFMFLLAAALYLLLRIAHVEENLTVGSYLKAIGRLFVPVICGALLAGVILVPYANFLLNETSRMGATEPLSSRALTAAKTFIDADWAMLLLSKTIGSGLIDSGSGTYVELAPMAAESGVGGSFEFILLGYSGGVFLLLGQFYHWLFTEARLKDRILVVLGSILVVLYCCNFFLPSLFTMLVRLQYRSCFVVSLPFCAAMAVGFEKRMLDGSANGVITVLTGMFTLGILAWSLVMTDNGRLVCLAFMLGTVAALVMVYVLKTSERWHNLALATMVAAIFAMQVVDGFFCTNLRLQPIGEWFPNSVENYHGGDTRAALAYLHENDPSFYRIEKHFRMWSPFNDALVDHYPSVSAYNSTADGDVEDFYHLLWDEAIFKRAAYCQGFRQDHDRPDILALLDVKYILSDKDLSYSWCELYEQVGTVRIYRNTQASSLATVHQKVVAESVADALPDAAARRELLRDAVIVPDKVAGAWGAGSEQPAQGTEVSDFTASDDTHLAGSITVEDTSVVCLAVPHTGTWEITVDGTKVETFRANYGFYGFTLEPGAHTIEAEYHLAGLIPGIALTVVGALLTVVACVLFGRHEGRAPQIARGSHAA